MADHQHSEHDNDADIVELPESDITVDALTGTQQAATQAPRIKGSCSNPNWKPTVYEPYRP
ncbi:hypothetical protein PBI_OMNICRON_95 [Mycobacterium phage Omnicron]|uniref:Uncharacterized protein n=1 Tax=Mycobacterium phage Omnicron TaxID=1541819 RepID=A0A088FQK0_9CAUD|nr:hypothetical protein PBI_OMNICRON_95 [Mycobacterium phage Omnicron]AIM50428.1 hypothetical protein PBI_OMNICRON_95 [Mycobacterium phage Omnicron]